LCNSAARTTESLGLGSNAIINWRASMSTATVELSPAASKHFSWKCGGARHHVQLDVGRGYWLGRGRKDASKREAGPFLAPRMPDHKSHDGDGHQTKWHDKD